MIIPPDPEKDPRLFRESTASLITVPEGQLIALDNGPLLPDAAYHANPAAPAPYPYGAGPFSDDMEVAWGNDQLPPYDGIRRPNTLDPVERDAAAMSNGLERPVGYAHRTLPHGATLIRTASVASGSSGESSSAASASSRLLRRTPSTLPSATSTTAVSNQAPKLWEGQAGPSKRRWHGIPLPPARRQRHSRSASDASHWQKHKRSWLTVFAITALSIALAIGLAVGFSTNVNSRIHNPNRVLQDKPDSHTQINVWSQQCKHLTYDEKRDGPTEKEGIPSACNNFTLFNDTSSLTQLAVSSPYFEHYISTFLFPLKMAVNTTALNSTASWNGTLPTNVTARGLSNRKGSGWSAANATNAGPFSSSLEHELFVLATGLAATGTVEFVGTNAPDAVVSGGVEGHVRVDVVARYTKGENLTEIVNVCKLDRPDGSSGIGIFTPKQCDGDYSSRVTQSLLNPLYTPAFHVIIRLPPSVVQSQNTANVSSVYLPGINLNLAQMGTRLGSWRNIATVGKFELTADCGRGGGVVVDYLTAEDAIIRGGPNTVQGTFNVSQRLSINATSGTILANVILNDPSDPSDNSISVQSSLPMPHSSLTRRGAGEEYSDEYPEYDAPTYEGVNDTEQPPDADVYQNQAPSPSLSASPPPASETPKPAIVAPNHLVNTSFMTNEGFIFVAYLHHPPNIALRSLIASQSGMVDVSMHPNFVGPFALENGWGSIRLPAVDRYPLTGDPANLGRARTVVQGKVGLDNDCFALNGINMTENMEAPNSVTGAALWSPYPRKASVLDVRGVEGRGSSLAAMATLGDLQVTFDGK